MFLEVAPEVVSAAPQYLAATDFFSTGLGGLVKAVLALIGIIVAILALIKGIGNIGSGKFKQGVSIIFGGILAFALCLKPELLTSLADMAGTFLEKGADTAKDTVDGANSGGGL